MESKDADRSSVSGGEIDFATLLDPSIFQTHTKAATVMSMTHATLRDRSMDHVKVDDFYNYCKGLLDLGWVLSQSPTVRLAQPLWFSIADTGLECNCVWFEALFRCTAFADLVISSIRTKRLIREGRQTNRDWLRESKESSVDEAVTFETVTVKRAMGLLRVLLTKAREAWTDRPTSKKVDSEFRRAEQLYNALRWVAAWNQACSMTASWSPPYDRLDVCGTLYYICATCPVMDDCGPSLYTAIGECRDQAHERTLIAAARTLETAGRFADCLAVCKTYETQIQGKWEWTKDIQKVCTSLGLVATPDYELSTAYPTADETLVMGLSPLLEPPVFEPRVNL